MHTGHEVISDGSIVQSLPIIKFQDVQVCYRVPHEQIGSIKEYAIRWLQRRIKYEKLMALNDVSFEVYEGEIFGVIGQNGAGKSTALKVMARVLTPTSGRVRSRGMVAPLLELGAGFHPELTGRENVFLNGALLGHSRNEMKSLFQWILDFSELGDFIDAPIRTYSTGMQARLGFAVAVSKRPQILLVDEILSVGDTRFQYKCLERMNEFQKQGTTIVIVSHSMDTIRSYCKRALWLDHGKILKIGPADEVVYAYQDFVNSNVDRITMQIGKSEHQQSPQQETLLYDVAPTHPAYPYLLSAIRAGYEITYDGGYFAPDNILSRAQLAIFALRAKWGPKYEPRPATGLLFPDVPVDKWLSPYLEETFHFGLCFAKPGANYWPEMGVTRAQATYVLMKAIQPPGIEYTSAHGMFTDVPVDYWAAPWIEKAVRAGFISPNDEQSTRFLPEEPITRAETIVFMVKALNLPVETGN